MIDFKNKLKSGTIKKKINPIEIYESLDRRSEMGPLRPIQKEVLEEWWSNRKEEKDNILKLHTGQGKTIIGLLILQSKLNENEGRCLYVCSNKNLVKQTAQEAEKFGIKYTLIDNNENSLPESFLNSEKILITNVQKIFNGKSIFGINKKNTEVNAIVVDDAHACIESIKESFKIEINKNDDVYKNLIRLFEDDLREQGEGSFLDIQNGENSILPVPYWSWFDKQSEVLSILSKNKDKTEIKFTWPLIKDNIENCQCFFSGTKLEISTFLNPINEFKIFTQAEYRVLMSATTQNDAFFIKDLGIDTKAIKSPLTAKNEKWSGEKMVLIPSLINEDLNRELIISNIAELNQKISSGVVSITTSFKKTKLYEYVGCEIVNSSNIFEKINELKSQPQNYQPIVIVNRYDGIDLPDNTCRILILDSCPYAESLTENYEENCRSNSDIINIKIAQKVEQGMGRSVRGEKDYSVILIIGKDLVKFIRSSSYKKYFSDQTKKQIDIGFEIAKDAKEENQNSEDYFASFFNDLIKKCLDRDEGWKEFYKQYMDMESYETLQQSNNQNYIINVLELEREAETDFLIDKVDSAIEKIQKIIDDYCDKDDQIERGWYLQTLARYKYKISKTESNKIQKQAFQNNKQLLKPKEGIDYKKLEFIDASRTTKIKEWLQKHSDYDELIMSVDAIVSDLSFEQPSDKFESALEKLGSAIGFLSERPDNEFKKGPDNLWCGQDNEYFLFECKNEIDQSRDEITKKEISQMTTHCDWFKNNYKTDKVTRVIIIPTKQVSKQADFTYDIKIMRKNSLNQLKKNFKNFFREFKEYDLKKITYIGDDKIQYCLNCHNLDIDSLKRSYLEKPYQK